MQKVICIIIAVCFLVAIAFGGVQTCRLERSLERCEQYRTKLELAQNRESEIGECISRTNTILSKTSNTVEGLREKLKELEDSYNSLWNMFYDNDNNVSDREEQVEEK